MESLNRLPSYESQGGEINRNLEQIAKITACSATGAQQTTSALQDLSGLALTLHQLVGHFRLRAEGNEDGARMPRQSQIGTSHWGNGLGESLDFARVRMAHRNWRLKLRAFLDGKEDISPVKLASHQNCELGKWIYADAAVTFSHLPAFQELEKKHKSMHASVKQVVDLHNAEKMQAAAEAFARVANTGEEVVALLNKLEAQVARALAGSRGEWVKDCFTPKTVGAADCKGMTAHCGLDFTRTTVILDNPSSNVGGVTLADILRMTSSATTRFRRWWRSRHTSSGTSKNTPCTS